MLPNFKNHVVYQAEPTLRKICEPLQKSFATSYFNFVRRYDDQSEACLSTLPQWTEHFYKKRLYQKVMADRVFIKNEYLANKIKIIPWTQFQNSPVRQEQSRLYGIGVGVTIIFIRQGFADFFHFGTRDENVYMNGVYPSYSDCLIQFTHYFYDKAEKLLNEATARKNRLVLNDRVPYQNKEFQADIDVKTFLENTTAKRYALHLKDRTIYISRKEMLCIHQATLGKTAAEIGEALYISKRTVETHFEHIKDHFGITGGSRSELISSLIAHGFDIQRLFAIKVKD